MDEPSVSRNDGEWTSEELKLLFHCINLRGAHEGSMEYIFSRIDSRSEEEIREKIEEIRELLKKRNEKKVQEQSKYWSENETQLAYASEVQSWVNAVDKIQTSKRKIADRTCEALTGYFWDEIESCSCSSSKQLLLCTDSEFVPSYGRKDEVDFMKFYRFLHSAVTNSKFKTDLRSLEAAILLSIYEDIQNEVDDWRLEKKRKILKGMFRDIQDSELSDYDFRYANGYEDTITAQLNPFNLTEEFMDFSILDHLADEQRNIDQ